MNLLRRLFRSTGLYWRRRHGVDRKAAADLADLAAWHPSDTDAQLMDRRAYHLADQEDPEMT